MASRLRLLLPLLCLLALFALTAPALAQGEFTVSFHTLAYNATKHRIFFQVHLANRPSTKYSSTCYVNGVAVGCVPDTLGSLELTKATGTYSWYAVATSGGEQATTPWRIFVISADPPANTLATPKWFSIFQDSARVEWGKPDDATGYKVEVRKCDGETCEAAQTLTLGDVANASLTSASNCCTLDQTYQTRIQATTSTTESAWSEWRVFTYTSWPPQDFSIGASTATVSWTARTNIFGYGLQYQHGTDGPLNSWSADLATTTSVDLTGEVNSCCLNGETYRARLRTTVSDSPSSYSSWSRWVNFKFSGTSTVPAIPTNLAVTNKGVASWSAITSTIGTGYRVNLQAGTGGDLNTYSVANLATTSLNLLSGALPADQTRLCCTQGATYRINIEGYHDPGVKTPPSIEKYSPESSWVTFTFDGSPDPPTSFQVNDVSGEATWVKSGDASGYLIQLREIRGNVIGQSVSVNVGDVDTVNFNQAPDATNCCYEGGIYESRIQARNSFGNSAFASGGWLRFTYAGVSSIEPPLFVPATSSDDDGGGGAGGGAGGAPPAASTGEELLAAGLRLSAQQGLRSGIQFQRWGAGQVGVQSLVDRGVLDVVDVWGHASQDWEVCFPQGGTLVFLDAAMMPRELKPSITWSQDGYSCIASDRAGMVVLLSGPSPPAAAAAPQSMAQAQGQDLHNCMVRTNFILNLREGPGGEIVTLVPFDVTLTALQRTADWYRVDYLGTQGWISAGYVTPLGACA